MRTREVRLTETRVDGKPFHMVTIPRFGGGRDRKWFTDPKEAETYAQQKRVELLNQGVESLAISNEQRVTLLRAEKILEPYGKTVVDAAEFYSSHHERTKNSRLIDDVVTDFLAALKADGLSARYQKDCRNRLGRFQNSFGQRLVADISASEVGAWLRSLKDETDTPLAGITRNSYWLRLSALFNFAREYKWCVETPLLESQKAKVRSTEPETLTPDELARLLENASEETLPYWAIGAFCGLRSSELERLHWSEVHLDEETLLVEVKSSKSKTGARRFVPIRPALKAWLKDYANRKGRVSPQMLRKRLEADRLAAKITEWPNNALRHSFASYHAAEFQNAGVLAAEMGHRDPDVTYRHYRELVRPAVAHKYWNLFPANAAAARKVTQLTAAAN